MTRQLARFLLTMTLALLPALVVCCTAQQVNKASSTARDAETRRQTICDFVRVWAPDKPELEDVRKLCDAGESLKTIAAAYAGCDQSP